MPATQAKGGFATKFQRDSGGGVFQDVAEIMDITGPEISQEIVDATNMGSPEGFTEKIAVGIRDAADVTFSMNLIQDDASQNGLLQDVLASTSRSYRIIFPTGTKRISFTGLVKSIGHSFPMRDKMVNPVTITVTGKPLKEPHP